MSGSGPSTDFEKRVADWLGVDEAVGRILKQAIPLPAEEVPTGEAVGRALAEEVTATASLPPWDNSAMDGYAVRADDVTDASESAPVALTVIDVVRAGEPSPRTVGEGEAIRIMTGAPVPDGADTIIRVEDTDAEVEPGTVRILAARDRGRHIRPAGRDMREGDRLLGPRHPVTPGTVGLLTAAGRATVAVHRRPTVAVLTTGDELRTPDRYEDVQRGRGIPDSNGPMLAAMIAAAGGVPVPLGIASDDRAELGERLTRGTDCDVLVTVGGASMGEADLVKGVLDDSGFELDFWRVRMRPGSPISFGWLPSAEGRTAVFGLPGNPGSAFVTFEVFVRPFLLALAGHASVLRREVTCVSESEMSVPADLTHFQRVTVDRGPDGLTARLTGEQGSGLVSGLALAEGLAVVPPEVERVVPGDRVRVLLIDAAPAAERGPTG